jgi:predicted metal-dependent hydrolase
VENLRRGAEHFNRGRFFEAHEDWEIRWRKLPLPDRPQVQAAILVCGVFVLLGKNRIAPAERLAKLAIERFAEAATAAKIGGERPVLALPDAEDRLLRILARIRLGESGASGLLSEAEGLRAMIRGVS